MRECFADLAVEHEKHNQNQFRFRHTAFYTQLKSKVGKILTKDTTLL
jgi:hypothetical protein